MRMLEAIGSHHKSKQTNTFSDISIRKSVHIHTHRPFACQTFKSLWRIKHTYTRHDKRAKDTVHIWIFSFLFFIQWFYVHFQLLCHISASYLRSYTHTDTQYCDCYRFSCVFFFFLCFIFINYPFKHKISYIFIQSHL